MSALCGMIGHSLRSAGCPAAERKIVGFAAGFCPRRLSAGRAVGAQSPNYDPRLRRLVYRRGRAIYSADITALQADKQGWKVSLQNNETLSAPNAVVAWGRGQRIS